MPERQDWALILHGGARTIAARDMAANRKGCLLAAQAGRQILSEGGSAIDAVEAVVWALELDSTFNAGLCAVANSLGVIERDAAIMCGTDLAIGAVGALQDVPHPIHVARRLMAETPGLLVGDGARLFAAQHGLVVAGAVPTIKAAAGGDTVGCVALDAHGRMAVGLSTGGIDGKMPGRIGDTPLPGCGFYADDEVGGVALSGDGDNIARVMFAARVMSDLEDCSPQHAAERGLIHMARVGGEAGAIVLDTRGRFGCAHNSEHFAVALASSSLEPRVALHEDELREITSIG